MKAAALFPGQGSQFTGMGKTLCENFPIARETFEEANDAAQKNLGKICFDGPESELMLTENTQPCLVTASIASYRVAQKEFGFTPTVVAGHSLGEYSALVAAGALNFATAVRWVQARGRAMQRAVPAGEGKMAALLGMEDAAVEALCKEATAIAKSERGGNSESSSAISVEAIVEPANFNAPGQIVIAGSADAVDQAVKLLSSGKFPGGKAIPLAVSAPFHCRLMAPARNEMAALFQKAIQKAVQKADATEKPGTLQCPYIPNRTARVTAESSVILDLLMEQIDHPVLWKQSMEALMQSGQAQAVEFGPGKVLQGLAKRIAKATGGTLDVISVGDTDSLKLLEGK
jgi:[acyl-carrier-protein] S-malonyltransferase